MNGWYGIVWRWHFYAGLLCIPFVLWLACTGAIYLWKPQVEALIDRPYDHLAVHGRPAPAADQIAAAIRAVPGSVFHKYELPERPDVAVRVIVGWGGEDVRVYVHPETLAVLKIVPEQERLMRIIFRLHGELMMGDKGSWLVELAASWAIVMLLTGLYLWWPRGRTGLGGVVWPRLGANGRLFWRDLHVVIGLWVSFFALFLLVSGLPWASAWGDYLKAVRTATGPAVHQDWSNRHGAGAVAGEHGEHADHGGMVMHHPVQDYRPLDLIAAAVTQQHLAAPVMIAPPLRAHGPWTAKSDAANRPLRATLTLDGATGEVLTREDFADRPVVDRVVGYGVAAHEGQLFGLANQLLGLFTAAGLVLLSISGLILWLRRRPEGTLGAPAPDGRYRMGAWLAGAAGLLGVLLPLFGTSLIAVLLAERLLLRRISPVARWLGLRASVSPA